MNGGPPDPDARPEPFPSVVRPMLAMLGELPADSAGWAAEFKWDGVRAISYLRGGRARVLSRNDRVITASYPELAALAEILGARQAVLDGEIVAFDESGRPDFGVLQARMHVQRPAPALLRQTPVAYYVFDLPHLDGCSTRQLPYLRRRALLAALGLEAGPIRTPPHFVGVPLADVLAASEQHGLEGVVLKREDSRYRPGVRSASWTKVKLWRDQEVLVGGWTVGKGHRADTVGALLVGVPGPGGLRYAGAVGAGLGGAELAVLRRRLDQLARPDPPFAATPPAEQLPAARWVTPELVAEVRFSGWTRDGVMRHPTWRGLRPDKTPGEL